MVLIIGEIYIAKQAEMDLLHWIMVKSLINKIQDFVAFL